MNDVDPSCEAAVTLTLRMNRNLFTPEFTSGDCTATIRDDAALESDVLRVTARDVDRLVSHYSQLSISRS